MQVEDLYDPIVEDVAPVGNEPRQPELAFEEVFVSALRKTDAEEAELHEGEEGLGRARGAFLEVAPSETNQDVLGLVREVGGALERAAETEDRAEISLLTRATLEPRPKAAQAPEHLRESAEPRLRSPLLGGAGSALPGSIGQAVEEEGDAALRVAHSLPARQVLETSKPSGDAELRSAADPRQADSQSAERWQPRVESRPADAVRERVGASLQELRRRDASSSASDPRRGPAEDRSVSRASPEPVPPPSSPVDSRSLGAREHLDPASSAAPQLSAQIEAAGSEESLSSLSRAPLAATAPSVAGRVASPPRSAAVRMGVEGVAQHAEFLATRGGGSARIRLNPPHLGEVDITVALRGQSVEVVIRADEASVQGVVLASREQLGDALQARELRMDSFEVLLSSKGDDERSGAGGFRREADQDSLDSRGAPARDGQWQDPALRREHATLSAFVDTKTRADERGVDLRI